MMNIFRTYKSIIKISKSQTFLSYLLLREYLSKLQPVVKVIQCKSLFKESDISWELYSNQMFVESEKSTSSGSSRIYLLIGFFFLFHIQIVFRFNLIEMIFYIVSNLPKFRLIKLLEYF